MHDNDNDEDGISWPVPTGDEMARDEHGFESGESLLRKPLALQIFARIFSAAEPASLVRSAVRIEVERRVHIGGMAEEAALEEVLLRLAFDAPQVLLTAFSGDDESEEWLEESLELTAIELAGTAA